MSQSGAMSCCPGAANGSLGWSDGAAKMSAKDLFEQRKKYSNSNVIMHETSQYHVQVRALCVGVHKQVEKLRPEDKWGDQSQRLPPTGPGLSHSGVKPFSLGSLPWGLGAEVGTTPGVLGRPAGAVHRSLWEGSCHPAPKQGTGLAGEAETKTLFIEHCGSFRWPCCVGATLRTLPPCALWTGRQPGRALSYT
ncbi:Hypothetical predicted protein [Marmota monax]|uniref:Uncharacterized protein n=1 Tax=Marmota monax TaxID=9995 RepID=A0A5E4AUJ5_MARMO|nr:Hypothetical predicted protein [Marmota monax]